MTSINRLFGPIMTVKELFGQGAWRRKETALSEIPSTPASTGAKIPPRTPLKESRSNQEIIEEIHLRLVKSTFLSMLIVAIWMETVWNAQERLCEQSSIRDKVDS